MHKSMQTWSRGSAVFQTKKQKCGQKCDLSDFDQGMIVDPRFEYIRNWDFHVEQSLDFAENGAKHQKTSSEQQFCRQKRVVNERGVRR